MCTFSDIWTSKKAQNPQFLHFWLPIVLRTTTVCTLSTSGCPEVVRTNLKVFYTFDLEMCFAPQPCTLFRHLDVKKWVEPFRFLHFWLGNVLRATTAWTFFDVWTSKSGPNLVCLVHFDLEMCFAPQRRAPFSTSELPKVVRTWCAFYILTWKCASHHNGVQFLISHLASWLRTRHSSEPPVRPSRAANHWKNMEKQSESRLSYLFVHLHLLSSLFLFSDLLTSFLLLLDSSHLCFSICPYCRKFDFLQLNDF